MKFTAIHSKQRKIEDQQELINELKVENQSLRTQLFNEERKYTDLKGSIMDIHYPLQQISRSLLEVETAARVIR